MITKSMDLNLGKASDAKVLGKETFSWLKTVGNNIRGIVGLTVSQKWAPDVNKTNGTEENGEEG